MAPTLTTFVQQRRASWDELSKLIERTDRGGLALAEARRLDRLFRAASADLARTRTSYAGTDAERFLNDLVGRAYLRIYRPSSDRGFAIRDFYRRGLPQLLRRERRYVQLSAFVFLLGCLLGALVVLVEPRGAELLVPEPMRDQLSQHRIWTDDILSASPPGAVSSKIATNNLTVVIVTFATGLLAGLGTFLELAFNGIFLGGTAAFTATHDMLPRLLDFICAHGPVELSVIVISGGAGFMLGHALIEPGPRTRAAALKARGADAVKLVLGVSPMLLCIGFVEGYVSPGNLFPSALKALLGLALGAALWGYLLISGRDAAEATAPADSASALRRSR